MQKRIMVLLDGGYVKKRYQRENSRFPKPEEIVRLCERITNQSPLSRHELVRIYWYDAPPLTATVTNPLSGKTIDLSRTPVAKQNTRLLEALEMEPYFAVRKGELNLAGWKLGDHAIKNAKKLNNGCIRADDLLPDISQKGVDMRIGLDVAWIATKKTADILVLATGDSDFVPAMKLARKEGLLVFLDTLGHQGVRRELKVHADLVLSTQIREPSATPANPA